MKVLFCTDGSRISFNSLKNFSKWVNDCEVDVITIIDWSFLPDNILVEADGFAISCANMADDILAFSKLEVESYGLKFGESFKLCGNVVEAILEQAQKKDYDLIILGSHGKKGLQKWLGSVSREISYGEHLSTYVSKNETLAERILFATDGSESAKHAIDKAFELFDLKDKIVYICTVNESPETLFLDGKMDTNWILEIERQQQLYSQETLINLQKVFEDKGIKVQGSAVLTGYPSQKIIDFAEHHSIDLIVSGSRNKNKMKDFLLGSVSKRILENAKCDVVIFK